MRTKATKEVFKYWQRHVASFKASGLTREAYSTKNRMQVYQLDYWRRKISRMAKTEEAISAVEWLPLKIRDDLAPKQARIKQAQEI